MVTTTSKHSKVNADVGDANEFAIAFVISVTEASDEPQNWIAKKGKDSVFAMLRDIFPEVRHEERLK
jgi:hypothetical protein